MAMTKEEIALDRARRKEQKKEVKKEKAAASKSAGEKEDFKTMLQRKEELRLKETRIKEWKQKLKGGKTTQEQETSEETTTATKTENEEKRTQALAYMEEELPSVEVLLVDKALSKEFFDIKLPLIMAHLDSMDTEKQTALVNLLRKLNSIKGHVGYEFAL
ncbi:hypothetical protein RFI_30877 [Reticulomyxa filosa]|uniref:Uncharacterized protein n=1 Tax=Reticulomyxa filosa TaxID=46433 RepID=X6LYT9_RETFI|nr:hypothetical protein RFI_30877 [Reticulomyxa filosa]|eukprot:ETO06516.1 hypothetical protein RFI_30877 [Reticulomyxa filosa]